MAGSEPTPHREPLLTVVTQREVARAATVARPMARPPLLVVGAAGSGIELVTAVVAGLGWVDHSGVARRFHDAAADLLDWSWDHPPTAELVRAAGDRLLPELRAALPALDGARPPVVGDARLALTLAWWRALLPASTRFVIVRRHPLAVARALQRRERVPLRRALAWWEHQWALALAQLHGRAVHVASVDAFCEDPARALPFAHGLLDLDDAAPDDAAMTLTALRALIRPAAVPSAALLDADGYLTVRQHELWNFLSILPPVVERLDVPSHLRSPSPGALSALIERDPATAVESAPVVPALAPPPVPPEPDGARLAELEARVHAAEAARDAAVAALGRADELRRVAETDATGLRHRLQVALYEATNLRATLTRIETARQAKQAEVGRWEMEALDAKARLAAALARQVQWDRERAALEASRSWRLAHWLGTWTHRFRRMLKPGSSR